MKGSSCSTDKSRPLPTPEKLRDIHTSNRGLQGSQVQSMSHNADESSCSNAVPDPLWDDWGIDDGALSCFLDGIEMMENDSDCRLSSQCDPKSKSKTDKTASKIEKKLQVENFCNIRNTNTSTPVKRKRVDEPSFGLPQLVQPPEVKKFKYSTLVNDTKSAPLSTSSITYSSSSLNKNLSVGNKIDKPASSTNCSIVPTSHNKTEIENLLGDLPANFADEWGEDDFEDSVSSDNRKEQQASFIKPNEQSVDISHIKTDLSGQVDNILADLPENFAMDWSDEDFDEPVNANNGKEQTECSSKALPEQPTVEVTNTKPSEEEPGSTTTTLKSDIAPKSNALKKPNIAPKSDAPKKCDIAPKSDAPKKCDIVPKSDAPKKCAIAPKSDASKKTEIVPKSESLKKTDARTKTDPKANKQVVIDDGSILKHLEDKDDKVKTKAADLVPDVQNKDESSSKPLNFYWLDLCEEPKTKGVLYLFGKVQPPNQKDYVNSCVVVKNLPQCFYLLPRKTKADGSPVKVSDVYNELNDEILPKYKISEFKSRKVEKNYCFDLEGVPEKADYLELRYSGALPSLPPNLQGKTFCRIFGHSTPLRETFLLDKKFKGPSWLTISNYEEIDSLKQVSWSRFEYNCDVRDVKLHSDGSKLLSPPLTLMSLNVQSLYNASTDRETIIFAGVTVQRSFPLQSTAEDDHNESFCYLNKPPGSIWPQDVNQLVNATTVKAKSEADMLTSLLAKIQEIDPDMYLGHDLNMELLVKQIINNHVPLWSRIGRLKRPTHPYHLLPTKGTKVETKGVLAGRLLCDVKVSAMELIRSKSYDLPSLGSQVLGMKEEQIANYTGPAIKKLFESSDGLKTFINWGMQHCLLNIRLVNELQVMPLAYEISSITSTTLSRTLLGGRSIRIESLLLQAFHSKNYIVPDKYRSREENGAEFRRSGTSSSYLGALVFDPKKALYNNYVVLLDFNSLYPSIIQEYNICFTTIKEGSSDNDGAKNKPIGILPEEISRLVESRKATKNLMKASNVPEDLMKQYDIRQKALKITANSMYGCLGFQNFRFYAQYLAAYITGKGRDILQNTKDTVENMGFEVIYGDTDSIMVNSNTTDINKAKEIGNKIKADINKMYKLLELEIDGLYRYLLLLDKKMYAAMVHDPKAKGDDEFVMELKGLDIVRRDWAEVGKTTARACLSEILTDQPLEDKVSKIKTILGEVSKQLRAGKVGVKDLLITQQLSKDPERYRDGEQFHAQVAVRMNKSGNLARKFREGDTVPYLFCTDGNPYHVTELRTKQTNKLSTKRLKVDAEYYVGHQVHPVVSQVCEIIPGLNGEKIAEALGIWFGSCAVLTERDEKGFRRRVY